MGSTKLVRPDQHILLVNQEVLGDQCRTFQRFELLDRIGFFESEKIAKLPEFTVNYLCFECLALILLNLTGRLAWRLLFFFT